MAEADDNIGDGAGADINAGDMEKINKRRRLRELWHGRFTNRDIATLLRHHEWDVEATNVFILDALPGEIRDVLGGEDWHLVENVRRNNVLRDLARLNRIGDEVRQYGCKPDDNMWWRRVPSRKPVSKCKRCNQKYDPIPREQEWGWARFECICGHKFNAFGMMDKSLLGPRYFGKSQSLCYKCMANLCEPIQILPPMRNAEKRGLGGRGRRPRRYTHRCTAPNCFNRYVPDPRSNEPLVQVCVHPNSLKEKVHGFGSDRHVSTGSTVRTFLPQDDLESSYEPSLSDIDEIALPGEIRDVLGGEDWQLVVNVGRDIVLRDLARLNRIGDELRQYGCKPDDNMWWRRVPSRKPVSQCKRCKQKYEPISREQE